MTASLLAGGAAAVNIVLLASAVVPPFVVLVVCRIAWVWAKHDEEERDTVSLGGIIRRALWLR